MKEGRGLKKRQTYSDLGMVMVALIWGTSTVVTKFALSNLPPLAFQAIRFCIAFIVIAVIFLKELLKIRKDELVIGAITGAAIFGTYSLQVVGLTYTSVTNAAFIASLGVVIIPLLESILKKSLPSRFVLISVCFCVAGLYLLTGWSGSLNFGDFLCLLCALFYSIYTLVIDRRGKNLNGISFSIVQLFTAAVLGIIIILITGGIDFKQVANSWVSLAFVGIFSTGLVIPTQIICQKYTTPTRIGIIVLLEPVAAAFLAFVFLNERISLSGIFGCLFIITGLILAEWKKV